MTTWTLWLFANVPPLGLAINHGWVTAACQVTNPPPTFIRVSVCVLLVAWSPEPRSTVFAESRRCAGRSEGLCPVTITVKLAILCSVASSAWMVCGPASHSGSTMAVSVKLPSLSARMTLLPSVSIIGMLASYERPMRPLGVKLLPCKLISAPSAMLEGLTCNEGPA